jgi:ketosteroid isomerase-like protein
MSMKKLIFILLILAGCSAPPPDVELLKKALVKTDQDFSQMSMDKGMRAAFTFYAADDVIKLREGKFPVFGKKDLEAYLQKIPDSLIHLRWAPVKSDVDGTIGYTFGKWEMRLAVPDTLMYGVYVTIWKKQADGTWKYVLDGGNSTPKQ